MNGQCGRNDGGALRQKRGDTLVGTIEQPYRVEKRHEAVDAAGEIGRDFDRKLDRLEQRLLWEWATLNP